DKQLALEALSSVGMLEKVWNRAGALSGGQKQRVAVARALTQQPSIMLAAEPVASRDPPTAHAVVAERERISAERELTVLINIHLMDLARQYTRRMIGLRDGELVYDGPTEGATDKDFEEIYGRAIRSQDRLDVYPWPREPHHSRSRRAREIRGAPPLSSPRSWASPSSPACPRSAGSTSTSARSCATGPTGRRR